MSSRERCAGDERAWPPLFIWFAHDEQKSRTSTLFHLYANCTGSVGGFPASDGPPSFEAMVESLGFVFLRIEEGGDG
jgi:hypothetical protein